MENRRSLGALLPLRARRPVVLSRYSVLGFSARPSLSTTVVNGDGTLGFGGGGGGALPGVTGAGTGTGTGGIGVTGLPARESARRTESVAAFVLRLSARRRASGEYAAAIGTSTLSDPISRNAVGAMVCVGSTRRSKTTVMVTESVTVGTVMPADNVSRCAASS